MHCSVCRKSAFDARRFNRQEAFTEMLFVRIQLLLLWAIIGAISIHAERVCEIPISSKHQYRYQWPLIFQSDGKLHPTTTNENGEISVRVPDGVQVLLSCGPNYLKYYHKQEVLNVRCHGTSGNFSVTADSKDKRNEVSGSTGEQRIQEYACDLRVIEEVLTPVEGCSDDTWTAASFGYVDPTSQLTHLLGEACYDTKEGRTLFAHVKLGKDVYLQKPAKNYLTSNRHPDGRYKIELFRGLHFDDIYERIRTQLQVRQAPYLKLENYIDTDLMSNAQYQAIKKLGWNYYVAMDGEQQLLADLKQDIKRLSANHDLDVYVGSLLTKKLKGSNGKKMLLYLQEDEQRFPVPELIWVLVRKQNKATAFVVFNKVQNSLRSEPNDDSPDEHIESIPMNCNSISWLSSHLKQATVNEILCCSYETLKKTVAHLPELKSINAMLI